MKICPPLPEYFNQAYQLFSEHRQQPWSQSLFQSSLKQSFSRIAVEDAQLAGYVLVSHVLDEAEIEDVYVKHLYRNQGVAKALLLEVIAALRNHAVSYIHLEVRQTNITAIALYESLKFTQVGERKNYYKTQDDRQESALLYTLVLT
jgi:ribosomal-protein-alanine N-acetyltransferase